MAGGRTFSMCSGMLTSSPRAPNFTCTSPATPSLVCSHITSTREPTTIGLRPAAAPVLPSSLSLSSSCSAKHCSWRPSSVPSSSSPSGIILSPSGTQTETPFGNNLSVFFSLQLVFKIFGTMKRSVSLSVALGLGIPFIKYLVARCR